MESHCIIILYIVVPTNLNFGLLQKFQPLQQFMIAIPFFQRRKHPHDALAGHPHVTVLFPIVRINIMIIPIATILWVN